jgi:membrane protein YqaA with SNARE-associated domain
MTDSATPQERESAEAVAGPVSRWAIHRRLYDWVLSFAHKKHSTAALFTLSFAESSFFPIPPDVLLMPMCLARRERALWYATVCTAASVLGGVAGYFIGYFAWEATQGFLYRVIPGFTPEVFQKVEQMYQSNAFLAVFTAGFSPIPYKVFTIAGGVCHISLVTFIVASVIARGMRFFMEAGLMYWFGPKVLPLIDKYFNLLTIVFTLLLVGGFLLVKLIK